MKKILLSLIILSLPIQSIFAYQVEVTETRSYEFQADGKAKKSPLNKIVYDIDEDNKIITEISVNANIDGKAVNTSGGSKYKIIQNKNSNIVAVRTWEIGEAIMKLDNMGNFYHFTSFQLFNTYFSQVAFGNYKRKD